jgi:DNA-binding transcriptional regulator YbjK
MTEVAASEVDGRRARTERGRTAVIDAMIDLVQEGHRPVTAEEVAARAQVSISSLFRYFDGLQELQAHTITRFTERYASAFEITDYCLGDRSQRISTYVSSRIALYQLIEPMARLLRARAYEHPNLQDFLHRMRINQTHQAAVHLEVGPDLAQTIATLTSFESWDQLTNDHLRNERQLGALWTSALEALLGVAEGFLANRASTGNKAKPR